MASCPTCGGKTIDEHGEVVCLACGRVQDTQREPEVFPDGARNLLGETRRDGLTVFGYPASALPQDEVIYDSEDSVPYA